ncbi:TAF10 [Enterospora canceri]|uniref:TAF10 n=1 Tax=Enterospora canceri TaxID=1081671 RepID=A0A1Y1S7R6_9MICR|nr:TAF10 [Enterospora canceri]
MKEEEFKERLSKYTPLLPESVIDHYLEKNGVKTDNESIRKTVSLMAHKFLTDIATNAYQFHKIHVKARSKDKRYAKEKRVTLQVPDVEKALEEMGIDISRPYYYT